MNLFRKIFAKKIKVLPLYLKQAEYIKAASAVLVRMMQTTDKDEWFNCENKIKSYEVQADDLLTLIYEELNEGRLMAVSRSDLQTIAMTADDFMDKICQIHTVVFSEAHRQPYRGLGKLHYVQCGCPRRYGGLYERFLQQYRPHQRPV